MKNNFKWLRPIYITLFLAFACINDALTQCPDLKDFSSPLTYTSATASTVSLTWGSAPGRDYYKVHVVGIGQFGGNITTNSITVNGLSAGQTYSFFIEAWEECTNSGGEPDTSTKTSNQISVTLVPPTPTNLGVVSTSITASAFQAKWDATLGASSYQLDVSTSPTFVSFSSSTVNHPTTQVLVSSGLAAGTKYYLRLRAINVNGTSGYANSSVTTILDPPVLTIASSTITSSSIITDWATVSEATGYRMDISLDDQFTAGNFFGDYENKLLTGTSHQVDNLQPETTYYVRMRTEKNSPTPILTSVNSNVVQILTRALPPTIESVTSIKSSSFVASWEQKETATEYRIDVALDGSFNSILPAYNNFLVNSTTITVTGLTPGSNYHWRVRAVNPTGSSLNSTHQATLTAPSTPLVFDKSNIASTGFTVNWTSVPTATEYDLFIYRDQNFSDAVEGYNPLVILHPTVTVNVTGLSPSTTYFIRLRVRNAPDMPDSGSDLVTITATTPATGVGNTTPSFKNTTFPSSFMADEKKVISTEVTGGIGDLSLRFYHRAISEENFVQENVSSSSGVYSIDIVNSWFDEFGIEFYWEVEDANQIQRDIPRTIVSAVSNVQIPVSSFGKDEKNYHILSIPYTLDEDNHINNAFEKVLGAYDKKKWRFSRFHNDRLLEYENGLSANLIGQGLGYWFISRDEVALDLGRGTSPSIYKTTPFKMKLNAGWNQIGNPFPYDLSWSDVLSINDSPLIVSELYVYRDGSFVEDDLLKAYSGGFVFSDSETELIFPVTLKPAAGGRKKPISTSSLTSPNWLLPISVTQGELINHLSGIGMHEEASRGKDKFDVVALPKLFRYLDFSSASQTIPYGLSTNVVNICDNYTWDYRVSSNSPEEIKLSWDKNVVLRLPESLVLHDITKNIILNMAMVDEYKLSTNSNIKIYYSRSITAPESTITLGNSFPNPFTTQITIPVAFSSSEADGATQVMVQISDMNGKVVWTSQQVLENEGVRNVTWDGKSLRDDTTPPGLYIYRVAGTTGSNDFIFHGKLIKR